MATQKDVAKLAGVSRISVSNYINNKGYISADKRVRIKNAIDELNYQPNVLARSLKLKQSHIIAVVFPKVENPFYSRIIHNIEDIARINGYNIILCLTDDNPEKERKYIKTLKNWPVDGFIINPTFELDANEYEELSNLHVVYINRCTPSTDKNRIFVKLDNAKGVRLGIEYLLELGHRNIGIIRGPGTITTGSERYEILIKLMKKYGIKLQERFIVTAPDFTEYHGYITTKELLNRGTLPTAIFSLCGGLSIGALKAIKEAGLHIPDDISFISFDNSNYTEFLDPPLTTILQPGNAFGITAMNAMLHLVNGKSIHNKVIELTPDLVIRDSCLNLASVNA